MRKEAGDVCVLGMVGWGHSHYKHNESHNTNLLRFP